MTTEFNTIKKYDIVEANPLNKDFFEAFTRLEEFMFSNLDDSVMVAKEVNIMKHEFIQRMRNQIQTTWLLKERIRRYDHKGLTCQKTNWFTTKTTQQGTPTIMSSAQTQLLQNDQSSIHQQQA